MRARAQLIREAGDSRETQSNKHLDDMADVLMEATQIATRAETEDQEAARAKRAAAELERWLEKVQALRKVS